MEITAIIFECSVPPTPHAIFEVCKKHWPECVWQDACSVIYKAEVDAESREFFVFESRLAASCYDFDGEAGAATSDEEWLAMRHTMIYFILDEYAVSVVGDRCVTGEVQGILAELQSGLGWIPT